MLRTCAVTVVAGALLTLPTLAEAKPPVRFGPGAPGIGDPYFPLDGNGGDDVAHCWLDLS